MTKYVQEWERRVRLKLNDGEVDQGLIEDHYRHIDWLQHERLVHLLVMLFVAFIMVVVFVMTFFVDGVWMMVLLGVLLILTGFYVRHYYFLENSVQRWYLLGDALSLAKNGDL